MKEKLTIHFERAGLEVVALFTRQLIRDCPHSFDGYLRQSILQKLLQKKLEKYRYSDSPKFKIQLSSIEALAWYIESRRQDLSHLSPYPLAILVNLIELLDREIRGRMAQLAITLPQD